MAKNCLDSILSASLFTAQVLVVSRAVKWSEEEYSSFIKADVIQTMSIQVLNNELQAVIVFECTHNTCSNHHKNIGGL